MEQWLTPPLVISLAALCLGAVNSYYTRKKDNRQELDKKLDELEKRITDSEASLKVLSMQMGLFWKTIEQQMASKFKNE